MEKQSTIEVRVRSTPTRFGGRHTPFGFVKDSAFTAFALTPTQIADLKTNRELFFELGDAPENREAIEVSIKETADALSAEKKAHAETRAELEKSRNTHAAEIVEHGKTRGELEALRQVTKARK